MAYPFLFLGFVGSVVVGCFIADHLMRRFFR